MGDDLNQELLKDVSKERNYKSKGKYDKPYVPSGYDLSKAERIDQISLKSLESKDYGVKSFTIISSMAPSEEVISKYVVYATSLFRMGYVCRITGDVYSELEKAIVNIPESKGKLHIYKMWTKREPEFKGGEIKVDNTSPTAFKVAANYDKNFLTRKPFFRYMLAREIEMLTGPDCLSPANVLLTDSVCGSMRFQANTFKYDNCGNVPVILKAAADAVVTVFNICNPNTVTLFKSYCTSTAQPSTSTVQEDTYNQNVTNNITKEETTNTQPVKQQTSVENVNNTYQQPTTPPVQTPVNINTTESVTTDTNNNYNDIVGDSNVNEYNIEDFI